MIGTEATIGDNHKTNHRIGTVIPTFSSFLLANLKDKSTMQEMIKKYETATGIKHSRRAYQKATHRLENMGKIRIARYEQLYIFPSEFKDNDVKEDMLENLPKWKRTTYYNLKKPNVKCFNCGYSEHTSLVIHHIDHNRKNNKPSNLSLVCANCHNLYHYGDRPFKMLNLLEMQKRLIVKPSMDSENITIEKSKANHETNRAHSTHRILLSMPYQGNQPEAGATAIKSFGRYHTARQIIFKESDVTIVAYQKKLNVWVHKPPGVRTQEQLLEAKVAGYRALIAFARTHSLTLEGYLNRILFSHHVVENEELNAAIKELIEKYPQIEERIGSKVCLTSHKGKVEHEGKARIDRIVRGDQVAKGLEYLTLDFPNDFSKFGTEALVPLTEQIKLHLAVQRETLEAIRELKEAIKKGKVV